MITEPRLHGRVIYPNGIDGYQALQQSARTFWQSRMTKNGNVPALPELTDIHALAKELRNENFSATDRASNSFDFRFG